MSESSLAIRTRGPIKARVRCPGSKSITNRALLIAALAHGESKLRGPLASDDTLYMGKALRALGAGISEDGDVWTVSGTGGNLCQPSEVLDVHASGTAARFLTALATLADGPAVIDGIERIRQRPVLDLVETLRELGAEIEIQGENGCPPIGTAGGGWFGGSASIDASKSSQYVSAVLLAAPYAERDVELSLQEGKLVSRPYVEITLDCMRAFGGDVNWTDDTTLCVAAGRHYMGRDYDIEPDASTAAYFFAAAAITGGQVTVEGLPGDSIQADARLLGLFEQMGCEVLRRDDSVSLRRIGPLRGIDVDMNDLPDAVLAFAVVAAFAEGPSAVRNVANLRLKECDRLEALENELNRIGVQASTTEDSLFINPGELHGAEIETYDDHRVAMAFALVGLCVPGIAIKDPGCVSKSWPQYFDELDKL
ncbi:MAG: 3-phosphoshikimate 1-carboxyvinyltransferase [Deltaproteobacteria bacterium]|nr:3-phosphoshikimate 1-carboxyvinyltransferase [Deltaproteobacteria bacterium]